MDGLFLSSLERIFQSIGAVVIPGLISQITPLSFNAYAAYFFVNFFLNMHAHLNVEVLPGNWVNTRLGQAFNATSFHALHHLRLQGHFGLFTGFLDRRLKTGFADYSEFHQRARTAEFSAIAGDGASLSPREQFQAASHPQPHAQLESLQNPGRPESHGPLEIQLHP